MRKYLVFILLISFFTGWWACNKEAGVTPNTGIGGSLAKFAIVGDFLYIVNNDDLRTYNISQPEKPDFVATTYIGWGIETLFAYSDKLFIGSQNGVYLFEIQKNGVPLKQSLYRHFNTCDPVVANGKYAFSTIRSGVDCRVKDTINELQILDISDFDNPKLVSKVKMTFPVGLSLDGNTLFVCDAGLRILDVTNKKSPREIAYLKDIDAIDVIHLDKLLLIIGKEKLTQLNYQDLANPKIVSVLALKN
jgi:hypothetical protein